MRRFTALVGGFSIAAFSSMTLPAQATSLFFEFGGGISKIQNGAPTLSVNAPASADIGPSANGSLFFALGTGLSALDAQIGIQTLFSTGTSFNEYYTLIAPYPVFRLQMSKIYVGAGLTPFVFKRFQTNPGVDTIGSLTGLATMGQVGLLFAITPKFSIAFQVDSQFVSVGGNVSPGPVIDVGAVLRFYFAASGKGGGGSSDSSNEFKGWRYPFGRELRN